MSDNPFSSPTAAEHVKPIEANSSTGLLTAILVICLVLGVLGFLASLFGIIGLVMQSTFSGMQGQTDEMAKQMQQMQSEQFVPSMIQIALNLIVAPLLAIAAIGGLARKPWAYGLLKIALLVAAIFVGIRTLLNIIVQIAMMGRMEKMVQSAMEQQGQNTAQGAEMASNFMQIGVTIGIVIGILWALGLIGFYLGSWWYLKRDKVKNYFGLTANTNSNV